MYSTTIAAGLVVGSDPNAGVRAQKGSAVTLHHSEGPKPITLPALAGLSQADAEKKITAAGATVGKSIDKQFSAKVDSGTVISAAKAEGDKGDLSNGGDYFEGMAVNLVVSLGAVPDVAGKSVSDAQAALSAVGLKTAAGSESYSDSVPNGDVIEAVPQSDGPVRPGDTMLLNTSKGPELFPVPNVVGKTRDDAKKALSDAGFTASYSTFWDGIPNGLTKVQTQSPDAKSQAPKGATVTLGITASG